MLEEDYRAHNNNILGGGSIHVHIDNLIRAGLEPAPTENNITNEIIREIIIPEIEKEINEGENFAQLRQIYHSIILAAWYKQVIQENLLDKIYVDQNKIKGVDIEDKDIKQKIYQQYLEAFKKGVYNYIREEYDPGTQSMIPRKYFSGGAVMQVTQMAGSPVLEVHKKDVKLPLPISRAVEDYLAKGPDIRKIEVRLAEPGEASQLEEALQKNEVDIGRIGKVYDIKKITLDRKHNFLIKARKYNRPWIQNFTLPITHRFPLSNERITEIMESAGVPYQAVIEEILTHLPKDILLYQFDTVHEDLLGFASVDLNLIALHRGVAENTAAVFHELGEFLIKLGRLNLTLNGDTLLVLAEGKKFSFPLEGEVLAIARKEDSDPHYLLRALQRLVFGNLDRSLTSQIVLEQNREKIMEKKNIETRLGFKSLIKYLLRKKNPTDLELQNKIIDMLKDLAGAGIITKHNLKYLVKSLNNKVFREWVKYFISTFILLKEAGIINNIKQGNIIHFFTVLALNKNKDDILRRLKILADGVISGKSDKEIMNIELLIKINEAAGESTGHAYWGLKELGESGVVFDIEILTKTTQAAGRFTGEAYLAMKELGVSGVVDEHNLREIESLLTAEGLREELRKSREYNNIEMNIDYDVYKEYLEAVTSLSQKGVIDSKNVREVLGVFQKIITRLDNSQRREVLRYIKKAAEEGVIRKENFGDWEAMFDSVAKDNDAPQALLLLKQSVDLVRSKVIEAAGAVETEEIKGVEDLISVVEGGPNKLKSLKALADGVISGRVNKMAANIELLTKIAQVAGVEWTGDAYWKLKELGESGVVFDIEILTKTSLTFLLSITPFWLNEVTASRYSLYTS